MRVTSARRRLVLGAGVLIALTGGTMMVAERSRPASSSVAHVMVIMLESRGYQATLGTCAADPYLCSLASSYASVTPWTAITHPSLPNYLAVTTGSTQGCTSNSCKADYLPSLGGQLNAAGIPWVAWMESMPFSCDTKDAKPYVWHHNPFVRESDSACSTHDVPYPGSTAAVAQLQSATPPDFVWITPNNTDNMHTGSVQQGDAWLQANLGPVLASSWFTAGNATVVVTMDESDPRGTTAVPMVVISGAAAGKGTVALAGDHYGTLRSVEEAYGLPLLGAASTGADLSALFGSSPPTPTPLPTATPSATATATPTATSVVSLPALPSG